MVFTLRSADMAVDRSYEHFEEKALKTMARMSVDKAFLIDHDWSTYSHIGKIFDATVKNGALWQKVYLLNDDFNRKVIKNILAGIFNKVSVGFGIDLRYMQCDSCGEGKSYYSYECDHYAGTDDCTITIKDITDYYEVSLVPIPAQRDAGIRRTVTMGVENVNSNVKSTIKAERTEQISDPNILIKDIESVIDESENKNQLNIKSSDTIINSEPNLGELVVKDVIKNEEQATVPETEEKTEAKAEVATEVKTEAAAQDESQAQDQANVETAQEEKTEEVVANEEVQAAAEEVVAPVQEEKAVDVSKSVLDAVEALTKAIESLQALVNKQQEILQKSVETSEAIEAANGEKSKQLEEQIKEQGERLNILCGVVEAAVTHNLETIVMESTTKNSNSVAAGNTNWFKELNDGFLAGGQ